MPSVPRPTGGPRLRSRVLLAALAAATLLGAAALPAQEPVPMSNVQGEIVNFETPLIRPILVTSDGEHVVAVNEPDLRLVVARADDLTQVAEIPAGQGLTALAERPGGGEIWASAAHSSSVVVIDTATWEVTHVLRPPPAGETLGDAATPGGIAFSADGSKAWVAAQATDALVVWDAETKSHLKTVPVAVEHNGVVSRLREPRAVFRHGDVVYVAVYRSGNNTMAGPVDYLGLHPEVIDLNRRDGLSLPDVDVLGFSTVDESLVWAQRRVGTLNFGLAVHPATGEIVVSTMDALNGRMLGESAARDGRFTLNRLVMMEPGAEPGDYRRVVLEDLADGAGTRSLAMPNDVVIDAQGRIFVAAYASASIGAFDSSGSLLGVIDAGSGPRGLAVDPAGERLFSLDRIAGTISRYDISAGIPGGPDATVPIGHDPTYDRVADGRALFHDAVRSSGGGSTGCFSCHPDLRADGVAWNLSVYHEPGDGFTVDDRPRFWKDLKGSMVTTDNRSLEDSAPYHWRGERKDLEAFNETFATVQKATPLSSQDFALLKEYTFSAVYPANPHQPLDREYSDFAFYGSQVFRNVPWTDSQSVCNDCHLLPVGSSGAINGRLVVGPYTAADHLLKGMSSQQFRGQWTKQSDHAQIVESGGTHVMVPVTGYGVEHTGSHRDVEHYVERQFAGFDDPQKQQAITRFITELDTGVSPFANYSYLLEQGTVAEFPADFFITQAEELNADLAAHGRVEILGDWIDLGLFFDRALGAWVASFSEYGPFTMDELVTFAEQGRAELLVLGVPVWSGERVGVDRDRDGSYDGDETTAGTDPTDPDSDGDGVWDSIDQAPLDPGVTTDDTSAPQVSNVQVQYVTTNAFRLLYETDTFSPTRVVYGEDTSYGMEVGDAFPPPAGSNRWRRHHSIVVRSLDDGTTYHFKIETLGQNGVEGASEDFTETTVSERIPLNPQTMHVDQLDLDALPVAEGTEFVATLRITNNRHEPVPDARVFGVWTLFRDGEPVGQIDGDSALTDADGFTTVSLVYEADPAGVEADFTVPMYRGRLPDDLPGVLDTVFPERRFAWSDSKVFSSRIPAQ